MKSHGISLIALLVLMLLSGPAQAGSSWVIDWWTLDAGGEIEAAGGSWTLSGTVGQWDATEANYLSGGDWSLTGGFWSGPSEAAPEVDAIFGDRFES